MFINKQQMVNSDNLNDFYLCNSALYNPLIYKFKVKKDF